MSENNELSSNIIIRSRFTKPEGSGLSDLHRGVKSLQKALSDIESKTYKVKIDLDDSALRRLGITLTSEVKAAAGKAADAANAVIQQRMGNGIRFQQVRVTNVSKGGKVTTSATDVSRSRQGFAETTLRQTRRSDNSSRLSETESDVLSQEESKRRSRRLKEAAKKEADRRERVQKRELLSFYREARTSEGMSRRDFRSQLGTDDALLFDEAIRDKNKRGKGRRALQEKQAKLLGKETESRANALVGAMDNYEAALKAQQQAEHDLNVNRMKMTAADIAAEKKQNEELAKVTKQRAEALVQAIDNYDKAAAKEQQVIHGANVDRMKMVAADIKAENKQRSDQDKETRQRAAAMVQGLDDWEKHQAQEAAAQKAAQEEKMRLVAADIKAENTARKEKDKANDARAKAIDKQFAEQEAEQNRQKSLADANARAAGMANAGTTTISRPGQPDEVIRKFTQDTSTFLKGGQQTDLSINDKTGVTKSSTRRKDSVGYKTRRQMLDAAARRLAKQQFEDADMEMYRQINRDLAAGTYGVNDLSEKGLITFTDIGNRRAADAEKLREQRRKEQKKFTRERNRQAQAQTTIGQLTGQGFKENGRTTSYNASRDREEVTRSFIKVTRRGLGDFEAMQVRVNTATGATTKTLLTQAAAARAVGDTFSHSVEKVALWLSATGLVFTGIRGFQALTTSILELEEATTLLARVGKSLGDDFEERKRGAEQVRDSILALSTATGGDAAQSLRAAAIFARAGQTKKQVVESTAASMIAAKVAELDVVEAAELLSAAYLQFGMTASQVLPILDGLNTLSNNYRVTTDDLLQSISRAGSVIAQQNGRLTELAATTAITSQVTARSGSEIGNAIKTISSNLARSDTQGMLFDKLYLSTLKADGTAKSYTQTLLDLSVATARLSEQEQNQIGIAVAGVRQRNILLAQMRNIVDIIKAENFIVFSEGDTASARKYGASFDELKDNADTLTASIERLKAEATQLAQSMSGPVTEVARDVISILSLMSSIMGAGGGLVARFALFVGVLGSVVVALKYVATGFGNVNLQLVNANAKFLAGALAARVYAKSAEDAARANTKIAVASKEMVLSLVKSYGIWIVVAGVVYALVQAYQAAIEKQQRLIELEEIAAQTSEKEVQRQKQKADAYINTADAITTLIREIDRLNKTGNAADKKTAENYQRQVKELADSAGIELDDKKTPAQQIVSIRRTGREKQLEAAESSEKRLQNLLKINETSAGGVEEEINVLKRGGLGFRAFGFDPRPQDVEAAGNTKLAQLALEASNPNADNSQEALNAFVEEYVELRKKAANGDSEAALTLSRFSAVADKTNAGFTTFIGLLDESSDKYSKLLAESRGYQDSLKQEQQRIEALKRAVKEANEVAYEREVRLEENAQKLHKYQKGEEFFEGVTSPIAQMMGTEGDWNTINDKIKETSTIVAEMIADIEKTPGLAKQYLPDVVKQEAALRKLRDQQLRLNYDASVNANSRDLNNAFTLNEAALQSRRRQNEAKNPGKFTGESEGLRSLEAESTAAARNLGSLTENRKLYGTRLKLIDAMDISDTQKDRERANLRGEMAANDLAIQEQLVRLADLEVAKARELYTVEADIAAARKASADEAARALGTLSEEDKLRALAQAKFFKDNPDKVLSVKEQFWADSRSVGIGRQLFGGHFADRLSPEKDPFSDLMTGAGLGGSFALDRASEEAAAFRGGRTDEEINRSAREKAARATAEADRLRTGVGVTPRLDVGSGAAGGFGPDGNANIDLTVRPTVADLSPLFTEFRVQTEQFYRDAVRKAKEAARAEFERINRSREPATAPTE